MPKFNEIKELAKRATESHLDDSVENYIDLANFVYNELKHLQHPIGRIVIKIRAEDGNTTYKELKDLGRFALYLID